MHVSAHVHVCVCACAHTHLWGAVTSLGDGVREKSTKRAVKVQEAEGYQSLSGLPTGAGSLQSERDATLSCLPWQNQRLLSSEPGRRWCRRR